MVIGKSKQHSHIATRCFCLTCLIFLNSFRSGIFLYLFAHFNLFFSARFSADAANFLVLPHFNSSGLICHTVWA